MEIKLEVANIKDFLSVLENFMNEKSINKDQLKIDNKSIESFKATIAKEYSTEEIIQMNSKIFLSEACVKKLDMYYCGWECDIESWILEDGRMFTTNHGSISEFRKEDFDLYKKGIIDYAESLKNIVY
jgi:hypothetical protein